MAQKPLLSVSNSNGEPLPAKAITSTSSYQATALPMVNHFERTGMQTAKADIKAIQKGQEMIFTLPADAYGKTSK